MPLGMLRYVCRSSPDNPVFYEIEKFRVVCLIELKNVAGEFPGIYGIGAMPAVVAFTLRTYMAPGPQHDFQAKIIIAP